MAPAIQCFAPPELGAKGMFEFGYFRSWNIRAVFENSGYTRFNLGPDSGSLSREVDKRNHVTILPSGLPVHCAVHRQSECVCILHFRGQ